MQEEQLIRDGRYCPVIYVDVDWTLTPDCGKTPLVVGGVSAVERIKELAEVANIYVWSTGGKKYCEEIVGSFGLTEYICGCMSKPNYLIDDAPTHEWFWGKELRPEWHKLTAQAVLDGNLDHIRSK